ncbi:hypothetical protein [Oceanomicrobium pacificus]|uniref:Lipoprotein n=1 Tax=Oceanomicrobium pacificus TaxID=2692916 RepID=A0A6B0U2Z6_9RHOB|nr:hypothetical protein [Oceanomicrobium pacificus]MXU65351.1 hypothetical protein [Oceanomicrobium pacificus]
MRMLLLALPLGLMACAQPDPSTILSPTGYRGSDDPCRKVTSGFILNQYGRTGTDLVACPLGYDGVADLRDRYGATLVISGDGNAIYRVPRG